MPSYRAHLDQNERQIREVVEVALPVVVKNHFLPAALHVFPVELFVDCSFCFHWSPVLLRFVGDRDLFSTSLHIPGRLVRFA